MKRIFAVLLVGLALAACDDSTQDVDVIHEVKGPTPDTIMTEDGVTLESYGSQNPYTAQLVSELMSERGVQLEIEHQSSLGHVLMVDEALVVRGVSPEGRIAELVLIPSSSPEITGVIVLQTDGDRFVNPFGGSSRNAGEPSELGGKEGGPQQALPMGCITIAMMQYQMCMTDCLKYGTPALVCRVQCFVYAVRVFFSCAQFNQE